MVANDEVAEIRIARAHPSQVPPPMTPGVHPHFAMIGVKLPLGPSANTPRRIDVAGRLPDLPSTRLFEAILTHGHGWIVPIENHHPHSKNTSPGTPNQKARELRRRNRMANVLPRRTSGGKQGRSAEGIG